ncbi:nucleotide sugar dehydrogenase [Phytohabitans suffuscus]|uniref:UDP-N-acetyl-D-mannosaminuronic acid dehydrogenase n=1 Tax=Phytohabitans suffuscus TaxID=624315 RepID=A0A6F8YRB6_9ACTN|nr:nucleotide sugar dehydrogenase [Phytohabitans suffuscus]BCB88533.1 UDP-N-acetyl-D-mannosaminuronic acid dehydrogenase [Phytohabitans suffuscus]
MRFLPDPHAPSVTVVGFGYVGSCLGVTLAERGMSVTGIDSDRRLVDELRQGRCPIPEPGLAQAVARLAGSPLLTCTTSYEPAGASDVVIVTVGTPVGPGHRLVTEQLEAACANLVPRLRPGQLVIVKSTVPPGTTRDLVVPLLERSGLVAGRDFGLAYCPERLAQGSALRQLAELPVVVGGYDPESTAAAVQFWKQALDVPVQALPGLETAEVVKLASNWWIDVNVALANELAQLCAPYGVDVLDVIAAANALPKGEGRVNILLPSVGVGGSCLTKDPWMAWRAAADRGIALETVRTARRVNDGMPARAGRLIVDELAGLGKAPPDCTVAVLGVAFKSNTGDLRDTPAAGVVDALRAAGVAVRLFDPLADPDDVAARFGARPAGSVEAAVSGVDAIAILAGHQEFHRLDFARLRSAVAMPCLIFDGRMYYPPDTIADLTRLGYRYRGVGR